MTVTVNNVAPALTVVADQTVDEGTVLSLTDVGTFTDPGFDNPDLGTVETFTYSINWGDGSAADTGNAVIDTAGSPGIATKGSFDGSHTYGDNGVYTVTITVTDDDGGFDSNSFDVTVDNVAPAVEAGDDQTTDEGTTISLDPATFNDAGWLDTHTATIDWGDGTVEAGVVAESDGDGSVSGSHAYGDNGVYTVTITVTDDDGAVSSDTLTITVLNVAPAVEAGPDQTGQWGDEITFTGSFTDPGFDDTHTIEWNFGDGVSSFDNLTTRHIYSMPGTYQVTLTITRGQVRSTGL